MEDLFFLQTHRRSVTDGLPFDVAIGEVSAACQSFVRMANMSAGAPLRNVWTFGYPESAHAQASGRLLLGQRAVKGYIVRRLIGDELAVPFAQGFELNFPIPNAMSGAPLVLERPAPAEEHALMAAPGMPPMIGRGLVDARFMERIPKRGVSGLPGNCGAPGMVAFVTDLLVS